MIGIGCILWVFTMLGIAFSTRLWHFMLTQGVMQGIASGFIFPVCVRFTSISGSLQRLTATTVCISFPVVPQEACLRDWRSIIGKLLRYFQVFGVLQFVRSSKLRRRCNFRHYQSHAFTLWSSKDHADKNRSRRHRPRSCLPSH